MIILQNENSRRSEQPFGCHHIGLLCITPLNQNTIELRLRSSSEMSITNSSVICSLQPTRICPENKGDDKAIAWSTGKRRAMTFIEIAALLKSL